MKYLVRYDKNNTLICQDTDNGLIFNFASERDKTNILREVAHIVNGNEKHTDAITRRDKALINGVELECIDIRREEETDLNGRSYGTYSLLAYYDNTVPIPKPVGDFILDNVPIEKRVITPNGVYIHYSDVCTLLKKYKNG